METHTEAYNNITAKLEAMGINIRANDPYAMFDIQACSELNPLMSTNEVNRKYRSAVRLIATDKRETRRTSAEEEVTLKDWYSVLVTKRGEVIQLLKQAPEKLKHKDDQMDHSYNTATIEIGVRLHMKLSRTFTGHHIRINTSNF